VCQSQASPATRDQEKVMPLTVGRRPRRTQPFSSSLLSSPFFLFSEPSGAQSSRSSKRVLSLTGLYPQLRSRSNPRAGCCFRSPQGGLWWGRKAFPKSLSSEEKRFFPCGGQGVVSLSRKQGNCTHEPPHLHPPPLMSASSQVKPPLTFRKEQRQDAPPSLNPPPVRRVHRVEPHEGPPDPDGEPGRSQARQPPHGRRPDARCRHQVRYSQPSSGPRVFLP
jgi:hypothetical protein